MPSERQQQLLGSGRWRALAAFIERWYAEPLSAPDGNTSQEIEATERRLGVKLPAALAEWYELVGRRLMGVQDTPTRLEELAIEEGRVRIWTEAQNVWRIEARLDAGDDPLCAVDGDASSHCDAPLSEVMLGMLVSETLVATWMPAEGHAHGSLGDLRSTVRGGYSEKASDEQVDALQGRYKRLALPSNPHFTAELLGDAFTVIRPPGWAVEWMTATDDAFVALDTLLGLTQPTGDQRVLVSFEGLSHDEHAAICGIYGVPRLELFSNAVAGLGHAVGGGGGKTPSVEIETAVPHQVVRRVLAALPPALHQKITIRTRPIAVARFHLIYPPPS